MEKWNITLSISRSHTNGTRRFQQIPMEVSPDEYVLDAVERAWAFHDRSLVYRHACHHSTCGACAMLVNGKEKLTCITRISSVTRNHGTIKLEPLRNFPVVADLAVDMSSLYMAMNDSAHPPVHGVGNSVLSYEKESDIFATDEEEHERLSDCIECGMCVSACPSSITSTTYVSPAALAGAHVAFSQEQNDSARDWTDQADGVWRCHSAFECTAVCPSGVDPAFRIMSLRRAIIKNRIKKIFS